MDSFTRGSQIFTHALRMMSQGMKAAVTISILLTVAWLLFQINNKILFRDIIYLFFDIWATLKLEISSFLFKSTDITIIIYDFGDNVTKTLSAIYYKNIMN